MPSFGWVLPFSIVTVVVGIALWRFIAQLPKRVRSLLYLSAVLYVVLVSPRRTSKDGLHEDEDGFQLALE
ncbi:MAG: hypothetical protein SGI97_03555 [candidate division Zixibacteria bacterium]|nr:hypothetical protein [candidate division Zixibacteria bacterium]